MFSTRKRSQPTQEQHRSQQRGSGNHRDTNQPQTDQPKRWLRSRRRFRNRDFGLNLRFHCYSFQHRSTIFFDRSIGSNYNRIQHALIIRLLNQTGLSDATTCVCTSSVDQCQQNGLTGLWQIGGVTHFNNTNNQRAWARCERFFAKHRVTHQTATARIVT